MEMWSEVLVPSGIWRMTMISFPASRVSPPASEMICMSVWRPRSW